MHCARGACILLSIKNIIKHYQYQKLDTAGHRPSPKKSRTRKSSLNVIQVSNYFYSHFTQIVWVTA